MSSADVLVIHNTLNTSGGGERVCVHLLKMLLEDGFNVTLVTCEKTDWRRVETILGVKLPRRPREVVALPVRARIFGIYQRLIAGLRALSVRHDVAINTTGDALPVPCDVTYIHFPTFAYGRYTTLAVWSKYYTSTFWRTYFEPYRKLQELLIDTIRQCSIVLCNSRFTRYYIRHVIGRDAIVVYPPVEVEEYLKLRDVDRRVDSVLYIARFTPEKKIEHILHIARLLKDVKFYVVGGLVPKNLPYFNYLLKLREKLGVRNVYFVPNAPHEVKVRLLARCKVYVHLMVSEHFGIAPVEAMASGLALVVPKFSGTWTDVCDQRYGHPFLRLDPQEVASLVERALCEYPRNVAPVEHVLKFSAVHFYRKMRKVLSRVM